MSCLFDSLSKFTNVDSFELRQMIVSYLKTNPKLMDDVTFQDIMTWEETNNDIYLNNMTQSETWGGAIEIKAFTNIFKLDVYVHIPTIQKKVEFLYNDSQKNSSINILWTGNHFIPLLFPNMNTVSTIN
jgi:hypothetical protein